MSEPQPETCELVMHRDLFNVVKAYVETMYPFVVYRMPEGAQVEGIDSYGVAPDARPASETPQERFRRLHPNPEERS